MENENEQLVVPPESEREKPKKGIRQAKKTK